jgi:protein SCO1/2
VIRRGVLALTGLLLGCGPPDPAVTSLSGALLPAATPRPTFTLTTTTGEPFGFGERTRGRLTLLFFGYTNCPDVCPATMANLGAVLSKLTSDDRGRIDVVFVTTDPERDTAERLTAWLGGFDREFIGLTGTIDAVVAAQRAAGVGPAIREGEGASYTVSHAAQVLVYSPDDSTHIAYPFGTRQSQWAADIPTLLTRWTGR